MIAVTAIRLVYTPERTFGPDFTWDDTNMVIILLVESNLTIVNAAYPRYVVFGLVDNKCIFVLALKCS
jgi:hypothetical protein